MRVLILSDIHANLEALAAVLAAAEGQWDQLWNLGDIVGYGGSPNQVIELIRPLQTIVLRGNHDRVCCGLTSPNAFNPTARAAALWTRAELSQANLDWLRELPQGPIAPENIAATCVHGSPLDEDSYILNMRDAWAPLQQMLTPITFFGHTHVQGGFSQKDHEWHELRPHLHPADPLSPETQKSKDSGTHTANLPISWTIPLPRGTRHLLNPGSVGQPRDRDWRASFAILNTEPEGGGTQTIAFHRVPYDLVASQGRILMAGLPDRLAAASAKAANLEAPYPGVATDGAGNVWIANCPGSAPYAVFEFSSSGATISGANGYTVSTGAYATAPTAIAIDGSGNVWSGTSNSVSPRTRESSAARERLKGSFRSR